jgi:hypothetical protein
LEADAKTRLDVLDRPLCMSRLLAGDQSFEGTTPLRRSAGGGRNEHGEAVRVNVERVSQRILGGVELRNADLSAVAKPAPVDDALSPQNRLIAKAADAQFEPPA